MFGCKRKRTREYLDGIAVDITKTDGVKLLVFCSKSADIVVPLDKVDMFRSALDDTTTAARTLV